MKVLFRLMIAMMIFTLGTAVFAEGFQMDRITMAAKQVEDEDDQYWLYFNSNANYDWMRMNLQGKFYFEDLDENWVDYSRDGMGDLYSGVKANFRFPELSKGLDASLGYKWNDNYEVYLYGLGYGWNPVKYLTLGVRYDEAKRNQLDPSIVPSDGENENDEDIEEEDFPGDLKRKQQEFYLTYSPEKWGYSLDLQRVEKDYPNDETSNALIFLTDHRLTWQATTKLGLGFRYKTSTTDCDNDPDFKDSDSNKWTVDGTYKLNQQWTLSGAYSQSEYTYNDDKFEGKPYYAETSADALSLKGKYTSNSNWWLATKFYTYDLYYNKDYHDRHNDPNDKDADYNTRTQNVIAFEFEQKLKPFNYNIEVFAKNFDYEVDPDDKDRDDGTTTGIIGTIVWDWINLHWSFRAAPCGDLSTRKANYELKATYKF
ncbi:MAG TPA: hypothetical protein VEC37_06485 [Bacillota bacterium]|nr:hypothetical protein [Bacillota bacterium]